MASKKVFIDSAWENNTAYPTKRGKCEFCGQKDDLKQAFDRQRYICINDHSCMLRWIKLKQKTVIL